MPHVTCRSTVGNNLGKTIFCPNYHNQCKYFKEHDKLAYQWNKTNCICSAQLALVQKVHIWDTKG